MPTINPYEIICDDILNFLEEQLLETAEGDEIFEFIHDKYGLKHSATMSLIGGLMARKILWSPRVGFFQKLHPWKKASKPST